MRIFIYFKQLKDKKNMKKIISTLAIIFVFSAVMQAQSDYKSAIGLRFGSGYYDLVSASYKTFISDPAAIELNAGFRSYGIIGYNWFNMSVAGSYQHHFDIAPVDGLKWFVGGGAIASFSSSSSSDYRGFGLGIFAAGGVDYKFANIPLNLTADIRPTIGIIEPFDYYDRFFFNGGFAARYTF